VAESWVVPPAAANLKRPESRCGTCLPSSTGIATIAATMIGTTFGDSSFAGTGTGSWFGNLKTRTGNSTLCLSTFTVPADTES
jgi:hypothetical protein